MDAEEHLAMQHDGAGLRVRAVRQGAQSDIVGTV